MGCIDNMGYVGGEYKCVGRVVPTERNPHTHFKTSELGLTMEIVMVFVQSDSYQIELFIIE